VADAPALDPAAVRQVGLLIADRQAGPFELAVRWIGME
jgi:monofunctional biosynthetic peptidoglycan transglycosylase